MRKIPIFAHFGHILMFTFRVILQMSRGNERPLMKGYFQSGIHRPSRLFMKVASWDSNPRLTDNHSLELNASRDGQSRFRKVSHLSKYKQNEVWSSVIVLTRLDVTIFRDVIAGQQNQSNFDTKHSLKSETFLKVPCLMVIYPTMSMLVFYSDGSSTNPDQVYNFCRAKIA